MDVPGNAQPRRIEADAHSRQRDRQIESRRHARRFAQPDTVNFHIRSRRETLARLMVAGIHHTARIDGGPQPREPVEFHVESGGIRAECLRAQLRSKIYLGRRNAQHVGCGIGHALIEAGRRVLYMRTSELVQRLQAARQTLQLPQALAKLDRYDLLILDDISYVRKDQAETSVLFELIAERYERRSILITANQPFSGWGNVFPDPGMTVAAIDRLIHHSTIFELHKVENYRGKEAARQRKIQRDNDKQNRRRQSTGDNDKQPKEPNP